MPLNRELGTIISILEMKVSYWLTLVNRALNLNLLCVLFYINMRERRSGMVSPYLEMRQINSQQPEKNVMYMWGSRLILK